MAGHKPNEKMRDKKIYGGMMGRKKAMGGGRIQKAMGGAMEVAKPN